MMKQDEQGNFIADDFKHGENFKIGHNNVIYPGVEVGNDVIIGNFNDIGKNLKAGNRVMIQGMCRISTNCILENDVTLKIGTILTSKVLIEEGGFMGPYSVTQGSTAYREERHGTIIGKNVFVGGGTQIAANKHIADGTIIGANSFVNKDIFYQGVYAGVPVRHIK